MKSDGGQNADRRAGAVSAGVSDSRQCVKLTENRHSLRPLSVGDTSAKLPSAYPQILPPSPSLPLATERQFSSTSPLPLPRFPGDLRDNGAIHKLFPLRPRRMRQAFFFHFVSFLSQSLQTSTQPRARSVLPVPLRSNRSRYAHFPPPDTLGGIVATIRPDTRRHLPLRQRGIPPPAG